MAGQWREEQSRCLRDIERRQEAEQSYMDEGVQLLELARNAQSLFANEEPREKRRLLNFLLSNCTWEDGEVVATFRQPFDLLAETAMSAARDAAGETAKTAKTEIWLGREDSNLRMTESKSVLLTLTLPESERNLVTVRELLALTYPRLQHVVKAAMRAAKERKRDEEVYQEYYDEHRVAAQTLLRTMSGQGSRFGGILAATGNRFLGTPQTERGSIFSTAAVNTDFLDSLPLRDISTRSDFRLGDLRGERPTSIYLCLPVARMEWHFRWLRLVVQMACITLERMGTYPRGRAPILFMMEEFATLEHMQIMERAAAYFPGFGVKLWAVLQDVTQLTRYYNKSWETFLGNAGLIQCFANGDEETLGYIARRLARLIEPFELRTAFARRRFTQLLMMEGEPPAAAMRLEHGDVAAIRERIVRHASAAFREAPLALPAR